MSVLASEAIGAPLRCAIHAASGSIAADTSAAASIRRGVAGTTIAAIRITTVFHDKPRPPLSAAKFVVTLMKATAAAFTTTYHSPAAALRSALPDAYRT